MPSRIVVAKELADVFKALPLPHRIRLAEALHAPECDANPSHRTLGLPATRASQHVSLPRAHRFAGEHSEGSHPFSLMTQPDLADGIIDGPRFIEARLGGDSRNRTLPYHAREIWATEPSNSP